MKSKDLPLRLNRGRLAWAFLRKRVNVDNLSPISRPEPALFYRTKPILRRPGAQLAMRHTGCTVDAGCQCVNRHVPLPVYKIVRPFYGEIDP